MPSVTHDGRSFLLDGRRIWLASGRVPYARVCRDSWADRIRAAKRAGLNCIETPVFWSRHEPRPGRFDFTGENDLRQFIDLIAKEGLYCILGLGPYIGSEYDFGGLPPWLVEHHAKIAYRTNNPTLLEACSRYITAVADQIRGWQVTSPAGGGNIVLLQVESEWTCGHEELGQAYLGELVRYCREAGLNLPIVNSNNLWQTVEGQIDGWSGNDHLLATMRQLAAVRPGHPRLVIDLAVARPASWGQPLPIRPDPAAMQRRLAEVLAGGGQFNLQCFAGGTNFAFAGGRLDSGPDRFACSAADAASLVDEAGRPNELYAPVRRIAHLATRFGKVFANLDPTFHPISLTPGVGGAASEGETLAKQRKGKKVTTPSGQPLTPVSIVHASGSQGSVVFLFGPGTPHGSDEFALLLGDGSTLPVRLPASGVGWCLFDVLISPKNKLDYSNLCAFGTVGQTFVCFGPRGSAARLAVNGSPVEATVPEDGSPEVIETESFTIVLLPEELVDHTHFTEDAVYVGASEIDAHGQAIPAPGVRHVLRVGADGKSGHAPAPHHQRPKPVPPKLAMGPWSVSDTGEYALGQSARFASIKSLQDLASLGCPTGYGWYRVRLAAKRAGKASLLLGHGGDRLHTFLDGKPTGVVGVGPGSHDLAHLTLKKGGQTLVVLADNLGRFAGGSNLGEPKGLVGEILSLDPIKAAAPKVVRGKPIELLAFTKPLWEISEGDTTAPDRLTWTIAHKGKLPVVMTLHNPPEAAVLVVNDAPFRYIDRSGPTHVIIPAETLGRGKATIQISLVDGADENEVRRVTDGVAFHEAVESLSDGAELAFAKWEAPQAGAFVPLKASAKRGTAPAWFRCHFTADGSHAPLYLDLAGMSKGCVYVNDRAIGRYFVATGEGKDVPPLLRLFVPDAWLKPGSHNDLLIFDEHGNLPTKVRLLHV